MGSKDDFLDGLLGMRRRGTKQEGATDQAGSADPAATPPNTSAAVNGAPEEFALPTHRQEKARTGLTPLDLLALPSGQRKLINWLSRKKQATPTEIIEGLGGNQAEVVEDLNGLVQSGYLHEALIDGEIVYRVVFRGVVRRGPVGLPGEIWARVDLDHLTFLRQLTLFRGLSDDELRDISTRLEERRYQRDEVVLWQGNVSEHVYLVKSGIVGIARYSAQNKDRKALAYLKQGDILGEYSAIMPDQSGIASATATALTAVHTILIRRAEFFELCKRYSSIAIELARILIQRLIATDSHISSSMGTRLCLVIATGNGAGATVLGTSMALALAHSTQKRTIYTEQPESHLLAGVLGVSPTLETVTHPDGFDVLIATGYSSLPPTVRATLVYEQLVTQYDNLVIGVPSWAEEIMSYLIGYADQILVVSTPDDESQERLAKVSAALKTLVHPERVGVYFVVNRTRPEHKDMQPGGRIDFDIPYLGHPVDVSTLQLSALPDPIRAMTESLADRLGRTNQVSIYIPTTIDVNQAVDTSGYVERTLAFLGERFGGATTNQARGVWNSADSGLVGEDIHIVRSYATQADIDRYLQEILDYMEQLKVELRQEAMALELNHKLMLI